MANGPFDVVVMPGILGTQLSYRGGAGGKTVLWCNPKQLVALTPLSIALAADGKSPWPAIGKTLFPDGPVQLGIYDSLLATLTAADLSWIFWGYDWRLDLQQLATHFISFLQATPLFTPFTVVAHSMGALIAMLAYPQWVALGNQPQWRKTLCVAPPLGGAHWASMVLNGLYWDSTLVRTLGNAYGVATAFLPGSGLLYSAVQGLLGECIGSWPSVYGLLPSNLGPWAGLDPLAGVALQASTYAAGPGGVQQQWLTNALNVQTALVAAYPKAAANTLSFVGKGLSTPRAFVFNGIWQSLAGYTTTMDGDGTVAFERVFMPAFLTETCENGSHNGMLTNSNVLSKIVLYDSDFPSAGADFDTEENLPKTAPAPVATLEPLKYETWAADFANKYADP